MVNAMLSPNNTTDNRIIVILPVIIKVAKQPTESTEPNIMIGVRVAKRSDTNPANGENNAIATFTRELIAPALAAEKPNSRRKKVGSHPSTAYTVSIVRN